MLQASIDVVSDIWPCIAVMAVVVFFASSRVFKGLDPALSHVVRRDVTIDGLRTFLAFAVFIHHMSNRRHALAPGGVYLPAVHFYFYLGSFGVAVFFMITGYLFWGKLLDTAGKPRWIELYVNRFFRIVPLYWFLIVVYAVATFWRSPLGVGDAIARGTPQLVKWLAFGAYPLPDPLLGDTFTLGMVGMTWTLVYEWCFYASLIVTSLLAAARYSGSVLVIALAVVLTTKLGLAGPLPYFIAFFLAGMLVARIARLYPALHGDGSARSFFAIALVIGAIALGDTAYSVAGVLLLWPFFFLVASGTSIFGVLTTKGATRLGHASYSTYLLHGLVLSMFFAPSLLGIWGSSSAKHFWPLALLSALTLVVVSALSYTFIEKAGINLGHRVIAPLRRRSRDDLGRPAVGPVSP